MASSSSSSSVTSSSSSTSSTSSSSVSSSSSSSTTLPDPRFYDSADSQEVFEIRRTIALEGNVYGPFEIHLWNDKGGALGVNTVMKNVRVSVSCGNEEYLGQDGVIGQEQVDEKWLEARSDGIQGSYIGPDYFTDDGQSTYKPIGGSPLGPSADWLSIGDIPPNCARHLHFRWNVPSGIATIFSSYIRIVISYTQEYMYYPLSSSSSSQSQTSSSSSSSSQTGTSSTSSSSSSQTSSSSSVSQTSSSSSVSQTSSSSSVSTSSSSQTGTSSSSVSQTSSSSSVSSSSTSSSSSSSSSSVNQIQMIIDNTKIDATLSNFPVAVDLSLPTFTDVFTELGANKLKMYFSNESGDKLYAEIEHYDHNNEEGLIHVRLDSISSSVDTNFYLNYASTLPDMTDYIGDPESTPAETVWDSDFLAVWHCSQDPTGGSGAIKDSTSGDSDGTAQNMESGDLVDAPNGGKGLNFDGDPEYVGFGDMPGVEGVSSLTIEVYGELDQFATINYIIAKYGASGSPFYANRTFAFITNTSAQLILDVVESGGNNVYRARSTDTLSTGTVYYLAGRFNSNENLILRINAAEPSSYAQQDNPGVITTRANSTALEFARYSGGPGNYMNGKLYEVRISDFKRPDEWLKATYYSLAGLLWTFPASISSTSSSSVSSSSSSATSSSSSSS